MASQSMHGRKITSMCDLPDLSLGHVEKYSKSNKIW